MEGRAAARALRVQAPGGVRRGAAPRLHLALFQEAQAGIRDPLPGLKDPPCVQTRLLACGLAGPGLVTDRFEQRNPDICLTGSRVSADRGASPVYHQEGAGRAALVIDTEIPETDAAARGALMDSSGS